jgi:hypothetical protein
MALTKANGTITQLTATGNSTEIDFSDAILGAISIRHTNGTGTITVGAAVRVEISHDGTSWDTDTTFVFGLTASATEFRSYTPPAEGGTIDAVRLAYTVPTGSTGHTLDARFSKTTAL